MPNPITNFKDSFGTDLGNKLITKEYLMSVYPNIAQEIGKTPELWTWGYGNNGRLGNASTTNVSTPVTTFAGGTNWKQVSAGNSHTAAIKTDGTLLVWGSNSNVKLGTNDTVSRSTPVTTFAGGTNWKQVSAGVRITAAIKTDGTLWTWGYRTNGQLGNAQFDTANTSTPITTFAGGNNWKQVACGGNFTAAIKTDGTLWTWGTSSDGNLGNGSYGAGAYRCTPVTTFAGGTNWKQVSCGYNHTAAIKTDGTLWTWGANNLFGELSTSPLGNAKIGAGTGSSTPITTFAGGTNWKQVFGGRGHTAAIKTDGTLWTWGLGDVGQLGNASLSTISTPVTTFAGGTNWKQVSITISGIFAGAPQTAAIKTDGTLWVWGGSGSGQAGNASTTNRSTPVTTFAGGTNWKQVSSGYVHTAAIRSTDFI